MMEHFRPQLWSLFVVKQDAFLCCFVFQVFSSEQSPWRQHSGLALQSQSRLVLPSGRRCIDNTVRHRRCRRAVQTVALFERSGCRGRYCGLGGKAEHTLQELRPASPLASAFRCLFVKNVEVVCDRFLKRLLGHNLGQSCRGAFSPGWSQQHELLLELRAPPGGFEEPLREHLVDRRRPRENGFLLLQRRLCVGGCVQNPCVQLETIPAHTGASRTYFSQQRLPIADTRAKLWTDVHVQQLFQSSFRERNSGFGRARRLKRLRACRCGRFGRTGLLDIVGEGRHARGRLRQGECHHCVRELFLVLLGHAPGGRRSGDGMPLLRLRLAIKLKLDVVRPIEFAVQQQLLRGGLLDVLVHHLAEDSVQLPHQNFEDPIQSSFRRWIDRLLRRCLHGGGIWQ